MAVADTIVCVDCGSTCHRVPFDPPELGWEEGDIVRYRCVGCRDEWFLELTREDVADEDDPGWP